MGKLLLHAAQLQSLSLRRKPRTAASDVGLPSQRFLRRAAISVCCFPLASTCLIK